MPAKTNEAAKLALWRENGDRSVTNGGIGRPRAGARWSADAVPICAAGHAWVTNATRRRELKQGRCEHRRLSSQGEQEKRVVSVPTDNPPPSVVRKQRCLRASAPRRPRISVCNVPIGGSAWYSGLIR